MGLSDRSCSDLRLTGDMEPWSGNGIINESGNRIIHSTVSRRPERLAGEAERPLMSLVRLETRALVSDCAEF